MNTTTEIQNKNFGVSASDADNFNLSAKTCGGASAPNGSVAYPNENPSDNGSITSNENTVDNGSITSNENTVDNGSITSPNGLETVNSDGTQIVGVKSKKNRIWEIDFLRGLCVILMILDHLSKLLGRYFGPAWYGNSMAGDGFAAFCKFCNEFQNSQARVIIHPIVVFFFFSVSGISCSFSRSNLKRGLQLAFVALLYTAATYGIQETANMSGMLVLFGVLHCLAACILLYSLVKFVCRSNKIAVICVSAAIVIVVSCLYFLYMPPKDTPLFFAIFFPPKYIYGVKSSFYSQSMFSPGDLFTLIPYSAMFFFGTFIAPIVYGKRRSLMPALDRGWQKPVSFIGRHALLIYVLHVLLLGAFFALISYLFITPGDWVLF